MDFSPAILLQGVIYITAALDVDGDTCGLMSKSAEKQLISWCECGAAGL
ncbi:MAG TPA: hypothetical protein VIH76_12475 [Candidatus Acidoferrales bacterium]